MGARLTLLLTALAGCWLGLEETRGAVAGGEGRVVKGQAPGSDGSATEVGAPGPDAGAETGGGTGSPTAWFAACDECAHQMCNEADVDPGSGIVVTPALYDTCFPPRTADNKAKDGPAKGQYIADLCQAVLDCVRSTGCWTQISGGQVIHHASDYFCYCGSVAGTGDCFVDGKADGPCREVIENAAETTMASTIVSGQFDPVAGKTAGRREHPHSRRASLVRTSPDKLGICASSCVPTDEPDAGTSGAGGQGGGGSAGSSGGAGVAGGVGGGAGGAGGSGTGGSVGCTTVTTISDACLKCQTVDNPQAGDRPGAGTPCDPISLTATSATDTDGNPYAIGWGPTSFESTAQAAATAALMRKIVALLPNSVHDNMNDTLSTASDINVSNGLLTLGTSNSSLLMHPENIATSGTALEEYRAAAIADATGTLGPPGLSTANAANNAKLGIYISTYAGNPTSAIGLADNLVTCALATPCQACLNASTTFQTTTVCPSNDGGVDAASLDGHEASTGGAGAAGQGGSGGTGSTGGSGGTRSTSGGTAGTVGAAGGGGGQALPCPDLDGDGIADCQQTLVSNAGFDHATTGWGEERGSTVTWISMDAQDQSASGALSVVNGDNNVADGSTLYAPSGTITTGASQCLPEPTSATYEVGVEVFVPPGQGEGAASLVIDSYLRRRIARPDHSGPSPFSARS